jgi:hypothetical protein
MTRQSGKETSMKIRTRLPFIVAGVALACTTAWAQDPAPAPAPAGGGCGVVKEFDRNLKDRDVYPINILELDGEPQRHRDFAHELPVGPHKFKIGNQIPIGELSFTVQRSRDKSIHDREMTIEIKPNTTYLVGAKLVREKWDDPREFWAPIIYEEGEVPCPRPK